MTDRSESANSKPTDVTSVEHPPLPGRLGRVVGTTLHLAFLGPLHNHKAKRRGKILIEGHAFDVAVLEALENCCQDYRVWHQLLALIQQLKNGQRVDDLEERAHTILDGITGFWFDLILETMEDDELTFIYDPRFITDMYAVEKILQGHARFTGKAEVVLRQLQCLRDLWNPYLSDVSDVEQKLIKENPYAGGMANGHGIQYRIRHRDLKARYGDNGVLYVSLHRLYKGGYVDGRHELAEDKKRWKGPLRILYFLTPKGVTWLNENRWRLEQLPNSEAAQSA